MAPYLTPNIIRQAMAAMTGEIIGGMASSAVRMGRARIGRLRRRAIPSPSRSSSTSAGPVMTAVFHTEPQKRPSRSTASV